MVASHTSSGCSSPWVVSPSCQMLCSAKELIFSTFSSLCWAKKLPLSKGRGERGKNLLTNSVMCFRLPEPACISHLSFRWLLLPGLGAAPFAIARESCKASASLSFAREKGGELISVLIGQKTSAYALSTDGQHAPNPREN